MNDDERRAHEINEAHDLAKTAQELQPRKTSPRGLEQLARAKAKEAAEALPDSEDTVDCLTEHFYDAIKQVAPKTTEYAQGWDDHVAAVRAAKSKGEPWTRATVAKLWDEVAAAKDGGLAKFFDAIAEAHNTSIGAGREKPSLGDIAMTMCNGGLSESIALEQAHASEPPSPRGEQGAPIRLTDDQEKTVKQWAEDDRLWTTQETVEFNLRVFARSILSQRPTPAMDDTKRLAIIEQLADQADTKGLTIGNGCYWSLNIGRKRISEGDTLRAAIDAAMTPNQP